MISRAALGGYGLLAVGLAATAVFMLYAGRSSQAEGGLGAWAWPVLPFYLWAVSPYAAMTWLAVRGRRRWLVVMAVLTALSLAGYLDAIVLRPDPQAGLLFVFLPALTHAAILAVALAFGVWDRFGPRVRA